MGLVFDEDASREAIIERTQQLLANPALAALLELLQTKEQLMKLRDCAWSNQGTLFIEVFPSDKECEPLPMPKELRELLSDTVSNYCTNKLHNVDLLLGLADEAVRRVLDKDQ